MTAARTKSFAKVYQEIEALPEGITGEILVPGVLETMSRPAFRHRWTLKKLVRALEPVDASEKGTAWWLEIEAEVRLPGGRLAVPDLAGWRTARLPQVPEDNPIAVLPDFACEILSPSTARRDRHRKLPLYASCGVAFTWLVDPELGLVEVYRSIKGMPTLVATAEGEGDDEPRLPPFDIPLAVGALWAPPKK
jgi:Uma2 family endonuclease